jgi:hypothetical protein
MADGTLLIPVTKDAIVSDERRPVLYDATNRPLMRPTGFRVRS